MSDTVGRDLFPPGEYIRDELEARNWTQEDLATILNRPLKSINQIINGKKAITPKTALELAKAFGTSADLWMNLESVYRLAQEPEGEEPVEERARLFNVAPVSEMVRRRWIASDVSPSVLENSLRSFFGVESLDEFPHLKAAARWTGPYDQITASQCAWALRVRHLAGAVEARRYDKSRAIRLGDKLHALTIAPEEVRHVPEVLSEMGIRFVLCEHLASTKIDGIATWTDDNQPVIGVSLRYDRIDGFWHTLAHEWRHIVNGDQMSLDIDLIGKDRIGTNRGELEMEARADREASNFLIPDEKLQSFIRRTTPRFSKVKIIQFANVHQIHPGIVVGQLQHLGAINYSHSREMLAPIRELLADSALTDGWGRHPGI
jgi:HTH-type transcriptional regulator/antitoxin HigA